METNSGGTSVPGKEERIRKEKGPVLQLGGMAEAHRKHLF
ncbi:rCG22321 [Rattus norvegicus]|uniref:RCG22321 n=1 Tax=Rattus norvegicus TaxID=10116 RepID=A6IPA8_RAT|nr:rCG22321 [Rattus norvegicus]